MIFLVLLSGVYTARDSKIGSADVEQPLHLRLACIDKLFKFICFVAGLAWLKFRASPWHLPIFESLSVYTARDSKIGSADVEQPLHLRLACIDKLFKFICFVAGLAWLKFRASPWHLPIFESLSV
jgi:hypothetical protein